MLEAFLFGTFWFWAILVAFSILEIIFIEFELVGWATFFLIAAGTFLQLLGGVNLLSYVVHNPGHVFLYIGFYFIIGALWSIIKWFFRVGKVREDYDVIKKQYDEYLVEATRHWQERKAKKDKIPERGQGTPYVEMVDDDEYGKPESFDTYILHRGQEPFEQRLSPSHNKGRITTWIAYWPFSALWTLIHDPVQKIAKAIYRYLQSTYETISRRAMRGTDFVNKKEV